MITEVSLVDSLIVSVFSIIVVFATLMVIAAIIGWIKLLSADDKKKEKGNLIQPQASVVKKEAIDLMEINENNGELVAVIAAAISANLRVNSQYVNIKTIKKVPQDLAR